uniref:Uncharacterized protein n=1 Tax=Cacopsylla melanoneura TaxID=428564 RepID=A0A8D9EQP7_9HEMI
MEERSMVAACGWKCPTHRKLGVTAVVVTATGLGAPSDPGADLSTLMTSVTSVVRGDIMHATVALKDQVEAEADAGKQTLPRLTIVFTYYLCLLFVTHLIVPLAMFRCSYISLLMCQELYKDLNILVWITIIL